jgi:deoxyadenosine kinase
MAYIVCIDGNIAAGKTTVLQEIERRGGKVYYEPFEGNPWLPLYYKDPKKYALNTQLWFLSERFRQYKNADFSSSGIVFIERSMYTDRFIFVELMKRQGNMTPMEVETYRHHFEIYKNPLPDLAITMSVMPEECLRRLRDRDREMESSVSLDYLEALHEVYVDNYPRLGVKSIKKYYPFPPEKIAELLMKTADEEYKAYNN